MSAFFCIRKTSKIYNFIYPTNPSYVVTTLFEDPRGLGLSTVPL